MSVILLLTRTLNNCFLSPEPALMRSELCDEQRTTERPARAAEGRPGQSGEREREWGESHITCDAGDTGDNAGMWSHQVGLARHMTVPSHTRPHS